MENIYSKDGKVLLHVIFRKKDFTKQRTDISPPEEFLQLSSLKLDKGKTFRPHKHVFCEKITNIAQESWVVIQGKVKVMLYDLEDKLTKETILKPGDVSLTFKGGHNYEILKENTLVYEYKTGPYLGQKFDKAFID